MISHAKNGEETTQREWEEIVWGWLANEQQLLQQSRGMTSGYSLVGAEGTKIGFNIKQKKEEWWEERTAKEGFKILSCQKFSGQRLVKEGKMTFCF